jgi:hypothetical protein
VRIGELGAEPAHRVDDEVPISDGVADISECVGEALEAAAIVVDGEISLLQVVEILQSIHSALGCVVEEETAHGVPSGEGGGAAVEHHVADRLRHGEVDP